jgi:hypothetical protein
VSLGALIALVRQNLRRGRRSFLLSVIGVSIGIASLSFFLALSRGVEQGVLARIFPIGQIEIVPQKSTLGGSLGGLSFGGPRVLDQGFVDALRARPEVLKVYRRAKLAFPARAWGGQELLGREVRAELIAEGLDPSATAGDDLAPRPFANPPDPASQKPCNADAECDRGEYCPWDTHRCEPPVPVVISPFLVEIYNGTIAKAHGLPQIGNLIANRLRGITFTAELGRSFLGGAATQLLGGGSKAVQAEPHQRKMMLVGVSAAASPLALSVPMEYVHAWNAQYAGEAAGRELSSVVALVKKGASTTSLIAFARAQGYEIADSGAERAGLAITLVTLLFALVSLAILLVAAMNIAHSFFRVVAERRRELGLMRALGATERDLSAMLLTEAAALGLCGGVLGVVGARLFALLIDLGAKRLVPDFPFKPDTFFAFDASVIAIGLGASLLACLLGALLPARLAARVDPAAALQGN